MNIGNIGFNHSHDSDFIINRPQGSGDYMLLLLKTPAFFTLNGSEMLTEPNSFILYSEDEPQMYRACGAQFTNDWFHFKLQEGDEALLAELEIPQNQIVRIGDMNELSLMINHLCYENYSSNRFKSETIQLYLKLFFIKLSNKIHVSNKEISSTHYNKMSIVRTKMYNQPFLPWTIAGLSHELTMSKSCFQHLYKDFFGVSPITDLILSRIEHAKYLLSTTDISVKKVSEMCGYNNEIHFMRQFKQQMKQTPSQYREAIQLTGSRT
ncbi:AraC family transcriptional regulator [Paenibacillus sp. Leaf72]|uniref:AraC family transcriptional regulator n=1 Tax=Paenibacillus sp. Leaf72 TaxID=1736234 RepID=UPI0007009D83|nr:AraC family transcriptional regulator [Paenibacillus sp. Leaf72]KQO18402.1 hypothetical protein ASF12_07270 [Paenibacillus sp. Leaf72]